VIQPKRLIVFDVDGTLVDSQNDIVRSMTLSFEALGLDAPDRSRIVGIIGVSLEIAVAQLAPDLSSKMYDALVEGYKSAYTSLRAQNGSTLSSPLYPNAHRVLQGLHDTPQYLLGVATGKSRRGLDVLLHEHDLADFFVTLQTADTHPSKPHPAMLQAALADAGIEAQNAVMIGDTQFDLGMAQAAGLYSIGVIWGYHVSSRLATADHLAADFLQIPTLLTEIWPQ
jgi:phosphoglycolate phosphatase